MRFLGRLLLQIFGNNRALAKNIQGTTAYAGDNLHFTIPTLCGNFSYIIIPKYIHNSVNIILVAIATIFKIKSAAKLLKYLEIIVPLG